MEEFGETMFESKEEMHEAMDELSWPSPPNYRVVILLAGKEFTSERMTWVEAQQFEVTVMDFNDQVEEVHLEKLITPWGGGDADWTQNFTR